MRRLMVLVALVLAAPAHGANVATPKMTQVASWAAGKPVSVWCENDVAEWTRMSTAVGFNSRASGFTRVGEPRIWLAPTVCAILTTGPRYPEFGYALKVLLHESWHAHGEANEAKAECAALVLMYSALHDFYAVPWLSPKLRLITNAAITHSRSAPAEYQNGC